MTRPAVIGGWLLVLLVLAAAAPALAQQQTETSVDLTLPNLPAPIPPGTTQRFNVTVRYGWPAGLAVQPTTVRVEVVDEPPWLTSAFSPQELTFAVAGRVTGDVDTQFTNLTLTVASDAPAFEPGIAIYRVSADANPPYAAAEKDIELELAAGFAGDINVTLPAGRMVEASGGFVTRVPVRIENRGNGPLLVTLEVLRFPAESKVLPPDTVAVGTAPEDRVVTAHVEVLVPWKVSETGPVEIEFRPSHATRGTPARAVELSFELDGKSAIPIPFGGAAPLLAALAAALACRSSAWGPRRRSF